MIEGDLVKIRQALEKDTLLEAVEETEKVLKELGYRKLPKDRPELREKIKAEYVKFNHQLIPIIAKANTTDEFAEIEAAEEVFYSQILALIPDKLPKDIHLKLTEWEGKPAVEFDDGDIFYQSQTIGEFLMHLSILMPNCELSDDIYIRKPYDDMDKRLQALKEGLELPSL